MRGGRQFSEGTCVKAGEHFRAFGLRPDQTTRLLNTPSVDLPSSLRLPASGLHQTPPSVSQKKSSPQSSSLSTVGMRPHRESRVLRAWAAHGPVLVVRRTFMCLLRHGRECSWARQGALEDKGLSLPTVPARGRAQQRRERGWPWEQSTCSKRSIYIPRIFQLQGTEFQLKLE